MTTGSKMPADPTDTPTVTRVAEGFYVRVAVDNIAWVDLGGEALVVDALEQPHLAGQVFEAIAETIGDVPVRHVLNTHTHGDHTALNAAFQARGAKIVNKKTTDIPPEGLWIEGAQRKALMLPTPGCHSDEDCIVWVPDDKILLVGDIFGWGLVPPNGDLMPGVDRLLLETYRRLIDCDATLVVPGHGPLCSTVELKRWVEYFRRLCAETTRAVADGKKDRQIAGEIPPPDDMHYWWRFLEWKHQDSLDKVLKAARKGRLAT